MAKQNAVKEEPLEKQLRKAQADILENRDKYRVGASRPFGVASGNVLLDIRGAFGNHRIE